MGFVVEAAQIFGLIKGTQAAVKGIDELTGAKAEREKMRQLMEEQTQMQRDEQTKRETELKDFQTKQQANLEQQAMAAGAARRRDDASRGTGGGRRSTILTGPLGLGGSNYGGGGGASRTLLGA